MAKAIRSPKLNPDRSLADVADARHSLVEARSEDLARVSQRLERQAEGISLASGASSPESAAWFDAEVAAAYHLALCAAGEPWEGEPTDHLTLAATESWLSALRKRFKLGVADRELADLCLAIDFVLAPALLETAELAARMGLDPAPLVALRWHPSEPGLADAEATAMRLRTLVAAKNRPSDLEVADDCGIVRLGGKEYVFSANARGVMKVLFEAARKDDVGMRISQIGTKIGSKVERFRLDMCFRQKSRSSYPGFKALIEVIEGKRARIRPEVARKWRAESPTARQ
jgi:hypothetical protein